MNAGTVMAGAGAAVGASIFAVGKASADYAGDMFDMARSTGMGVESFQKIAYAAKMSGIEAEKVTTSFIKFDKMIVDAPAGTRRTCRRLRISAFRSRTAPETFASRTRFSRTWPKFSTIPKMAPQKRLWRSNYSEVGRRVDPYAERWEKRFAGVLREAERMGLVLSAEAIGKGDAFSDQLEQIGQQVKGVKLQLGTALIPALSAAAEKIAAVIDKITRWVQENPELAATIGNIAMTVGKWLAILGTAAIAIGGATFIVGSSERYSERCLIL